MFGKIVKKVTIYIVLIILLLIASGIFFISFQRDKIALIKSNKDSVQMEYDRLKKSNMDLKEEISQKSREYQEISDKVNGIEELIGIKPVNQIKISKRLKDINITQLQEQKLLEFVPNGTPLPDMRISAKFGWRIHPILKRREFHAGIDLKAKRGTPIKAPADGVVEFAGFHKKSGFGNLIIIDHNFGFKTQYGHLGKKIVVKRGQFVKKGEVIGYTGSSGLSTGPHLHYEVRFISIPLNPIYFLKWNRKNFKDIFKKEKLVPWRSLISMMNSQYPHQKQR